MHTEQAGGFVNSRDPAVFSYGKGARQSWMRRVRPTDEEGHPSGLDALGLTPKIDRPGSHDEAQLRNQLADDNRFLQRDLLRITGDEIIGADFGLREVMYKVRLVAPTNSPAHLTAFLVALLLTVAAPTGANDSTTQPQPSSVTPVQEELMHPETTEEDTFRNDSGLAGVLVAGTMCFPVQRKLERCHQKALRRLQENESCHQLFAELGANGSEEIRRTIYLAAPRDQELGLCSSGAVAFTTVGNRQIFLCKGFSRLSDIQATLVLIHEALHSAGLDEHPHRPDAMRSDQISDMVRSHCRP
jgi:hypothetical protein